MEKVLIRMRLSAHQAHYGGGLVDGAFIMQLFGDCATELLIRKDGDEGLFRAYSSVDFLEPLYAGDYVEVTAWITKAGNTSRKMEFEAYKVIESLPKINPKPIVSTIWRRYDNGNRLPFLFYLITYLMD